MCSVATVLPAICTASFGEVKQATLKIIDVALPYTRTGTTTSVALLAGVFSPGLHANRGLYTPDCTGELLFFEP